MKIAILLTCHNRKTHTLKCLEALKKALNNSYIKVQYQIYLTDDGSSDSTTEAVLELHPEVTVLKGNGNLFWAGGMRNSWNEALKGDFYGFLLLNDDTIVNDTVFNVINKSVKKCYNKYSKNGILVGATFDNETKIFSYGGYNYINKFKGTYTKVLPSNHIQACELGNANIMFVHKDVVSQIGILATCYIHGVADFDYTLTAVKNNIPVVVMPGFLGGCSNDKKNKTEKITELKTFKERYTFLMSPLGFAFKDNWCFQSRFFPHRLIFILIGAIFKLFFPKLYVLIQNKVRS